MEIEIKIRLPSENDVAKLEHALGDHPVSSEDQENVFFDGVHKELYVLKHCIVEDSIATLDEY
jgi:adenylate cyclase class IV